MTKAVLDLRLKGQRPQNRWVANFWSFLSYELGFNYPQYSHGNYLDRCQHMCTPHQVEIGTTVWVITWLSAALWHSYKCRSPKSEIWQTLLLLVALDWSWKYHEPQCWRALDQVVSSLEHLFKWLSVTCISATVHLHKCKPLTLIQVTSLTPLSGSLNWPPGQVQSVPNFKFFWKALGRLPLIGTQASDIFYWSTVAVQYLVQIWKMWTVPDEELHIVFPSVHLCLVRPLTTLVYQSCFTAISICIEPPQTDLMYSSLCQTLLTARSVHWLRIKF